MYDIDLTRPLKVNHWMTRDCCLWLKAVNAQRCARFVDLTINKNHLALVDRGVVPNYVWETNQGRGLSFNAAHYKSGLTSIQNMATGAVARTVMLWFKLNNLTDIYREIIQIGGVNNTGERFSPWLDNLGLGMECAGIGIGGAWTPDYNWHHLAAVQTGSTLGSVFMYLDGKPFSATASHPTTSVKPNNQIALAQLTHAPGAYDFYGLLDDLRIYNRAMSYPEIVNIYDDSLRMNYLAINRIKSAGTMIHGGAFTNNYVPGRSVIYGGGMGL